MHQQILISAKLYAVSTLDFFRNSLKFVGSFVLKMPRIFEREEYADIVFIYGFCDGNADAASREYARRFPDRVTPTRGVFVRTYQRLRETGSTAVTQRGVGNFAVLNDARRTEEILDHFEEDPETSVRRCGAELDVSPTTVWRTLNADGQHPYHKQKVQNLLPEDPPRRREFCQWMIDQNDADRRFARKILWTDEATFTRHGIFNQRNSHVWSHENPLSIQEHHYQHGFSVNVWMGLLDNLVIGPHILPPRLDGANFLDFLQNALPELLDDVSLQRRQESLFQMDGCPAHWSLACRAWMNENYPQKWIGRTSARDESLMFWPARSPDLTPLDFFAWGAVKQKVYATPVPDEDNLRRRIVQVCGEITRTQCRAATSSVIERCRMCVRQNGLHFEHLL